VRIDLAIGRSVVLGLMARRFGNDELGLRERVGTKILS